MERPVSVEITTTKNVVMEEYFLLRAIRDNGTTKVVIAERECEAEPTVAEIARFAVETNATFVSSVKNYRIKQ